MKTMKKIISICLSLTLLLSAGYTAMPVSAALSSSDLTGTIGKIGTTTGSGKNLTYKDTFTEDWEGGLDLNKWKVEKYDESYISDFQVVDDPLNKGNKVITFSRLSTWLVVSDEYWPANGLQAGEMKTVKFRMYLNPVKPEEACITGYHRGWEPGFVSRYVSPTLNDGYAFAFRDEAYYKDGKNGFVSVNSCMNGSWLPQGQFNSFHSKNFFVPDFDLTDWIDVTVEYNGANMSFVAIDQQGNVANAEKCMSPISYGKYVIGNRLLERITNDVQTNGNLYIDDIEITFSQSMNDTNVEQKDVIAYYAGNTFLDPGDTIDITGEKLGTTVQSAKIKKIDTGMSDDVSKANYINENTYDKTNLLNVAWEDIPAVDDTEMNLEILQRSDIGIKMILPDGSEDGCSDAYKERGSYALLLESVSEEGKDAVVVINNPQINILLHDDGDYATPNGWLKLSGYNLSVQNDLSKVHAIILDKNGNRTLVNNNMLEVDTTENNNGVSNDYYIMVHLKNMQPGEYQIMVHNGFGGNYGWSMPYEFTVKSQAANDVWRAKGVFNVQDYGAVGDSDTNDTAAIMSAINAAEQNGGGIVYFPKLKNGKGASYRITHPLTIGENISLVGDGKDMSMVFYDGMLDTEKQEYFIAFEGNFEISNIDFSCMTNPFKNFLKRSIKKHAKAAKVYFDDAYLMVDPRGLVTNSGLGVLMEGYKDADAYNYLEDIWNGTEQYLYRQNDIADTFFCVENSDLQIASKLGQTHAHLFVNSDYMYFDGLEVDRGEVKWSVLTTNVAGFFENGTIQSMSGHMHYRNVESSHDTVNNRELFLRDGGAKKVNTHIQPLEYEENDRYYKELLENELDKMSSDNEKNALIQKVKDFANEYQGRSYRFLDYVPSENGWIFITYGQGAGQIRRIVKIEKVGNYYYVAIDDAFAVTPNRSSEVAFATNIGYKTVVNNGYFEDGSYVGPYGAATDVVFDNITMRKSASGVGFTYAYEGFMWYCTAKNVDARELSNLHATYAENGTPAGMIAGGGVVVGNTFLGFRYCNSYVGEGGSLRVHNLALLKTVEGTDLVFENIQFASETPGMLVEGSSTLQGVWLKDIVQHTAIGRADSVYSQISPYTYSSLWHIKEGMRKQVYGTPIIWCDSVSVDQTRQRGDVNGDGMITLKDADLLRYYLGESISASELNASYGDNTANLYADVTEDGVVDVRDFLYVRAYILGDEEAMAALKAGGSNSSEPNKPGDKLTIVEDDVILDYSIIKDEEEDKRNPELDYDGVEDVD